MKLRLLSKSLRSLAIPGEGREGIHTRVLTHAPPQSAKNSSLILQQAHYQ